MLPLHYSPESAAGEIRTPDPRFIRTTLYTTELLLRFVVNRPNGFQPTGLILYEHLVERGSHNIMVVYSLSVVNYFSLQSVTL